MAVDGEDGVPILNIEGVGKDFDRSQEPCHVAGSKDYGLLNTDRYNFLVRLIIFEIIETKIHGRRTEAVEK